MGAGTPDSSTQTIRKLIHEIAESHGSQYQLWGELIRCENPSDHVELRFSSVWTGAKNPKDAQVRARILLSPTALCNLKQLLGSL